MNDKRGPGVPEAVQQTLLVLEARVGVPAMDRLWIFPPLIKGRQERGLIALSAFSEEDERRRIITAAYNAERTGRGLTFEPVLMEEGTAPPDALDRIMNGVVRRTEVELGEPREAAIGGDSEAFETLRSEFDPGQLEAADT